MEGEKRGDDDSHEPGGKLYELDEEREHTSLADTKTLFIFWIHKQ